MIDNFSEFLNFKVISQTQPVHLYLISVDSPRSLLWVRHSRHPTHFLSSPLLSSRLHSPHRPPSPWDAVSSSHLHHLQLLVLRSLHLRQCQIIPAKLQIFLLTITFCLLGSSIQLASCRDEVVVSWLFLARFQCQAECVGTMRSKGYVIFYCEEDVNVVMFSVARHYRI